MTLEELIPVYGENNAQYNSLKKVVGEQSGEIKKLMQGNKLDEKTVGDWTAKLTVKRSESFDEDKLIGIVKELGFADQLIETKEYVNMDALEEAIYRGDITQDMLAVQISKAKVVKETVALNIKKKKGVA